MNKLRYLNVFCMKSFNKKWCCSVSNREFRSLIQLLLFVRKYKKLGGKRYGYRISKLF